MFLAVLIKDGICIVDVDENFAALRVFGKLHEQAVASRKGKMAHFAGSFLAAANFDEFIVGPKGAVQERNVAGGCDFHAFRTTFRQTRRITKRFSCLFETKRHDGFLCRKRSTQFGADEVRIIAAQRSGCAYEGRRSGRIVAEAASKASAGREVLPLHRRVRAMEHIENTILRFENFLNGRCSEDEKRLELAQMEQSHDGIEVGRVQENASDWSSGGIRRRRSKLRRGDDLRAQVWRGTKQKPHLPVRRECKLSLRASSGFQGASAQFGAVAAAAIPLREATAGSRS